jgi:flavin reductase (DIM6/NTAB) family NADH-FMN oxidoreductase RutF
MNDGEGRRALAQALGRVPSGLFVVTVRRGEDETGMLASWVQQCSFEPPQVTVCLRRGRAINAWLSDGAAFAVNVLGEGQTALVRHFGRGFDPGEPAFTGLLIERPDGAAPVLADALAYLDCRVAGRCVAGDHDVLIGSVVGGRLLRDGAPYVHVRKNGLSY